MTICEQNRDKTVQERALAQFRETRYKLESDHPDLFRAVRNAVREPQDGSELLKVDRQKNMTAVMKFLELCPEPALFHHEIRKFLAQNQAS